MSDYELLLISTGIALGMFFFHRTGYSAGGIITPGFLALELASPWSIVIAFAFGGAVALMLSFTVRATGVYGRQRVALAMLFALLLRLLLKDCLQISSLWIGWVVPGLLGADMQRQGAVPTLGASLSTAFAAAMLMRLAASGGILP